MRRSLLAGVRHALTASALVLTASAAACNSDNVTSVPSVPASDTYASALGVDLSTMTKVSDALYYKDITVGTGEEAVAGKMVNARYSGWLTDGRPFDSGTYEFPLGAGRVIQGWDQGVAGMKVGGKRKLVIGSALAYGPEGSPPVIGPNKTLVFDVEVLSVR